MNGGWRTVLCTNGDICYITFEYNNMTFDSVHPCSWSCSPAGLPVPLQDILDWTPQIQTNNGPALGVITTRSGQLFIGRTNGWLAVDTNASFPPLPCGSAVNSQENTLGGVKSLFR